MSFILERAKAFASRDLNLSVENAAEAAADAISGVWEDTKFGRISVNDSRDFQTIVSERLYKIAKNYRRRFSRDLELDKPLAGRDGDQAISHLDAGLRFKTPPTQINDIYFSELKRGFERLPTKLRHVMVLLSQGYNADDISKELCMPIHTVFMRINEARRALFLHGLIASNYE